MASQTSLAAPVFDITGVPQNGFTYGTAPADDNVINFGGVTNTGSTVVDPGATPSTWLGSGLNASSVFVNSFVTVTGFAAGQNYTHRVDLLGSESGDIMQFTAPGGVTTTNEDNRNNNCAGCNHGPGQIQPTVPMGSTTYHSDGTNIPAFTLTDTECDYRWHRHQWRTQPHSGKLSREL